MKKVLRYLLSVLPMPGEWRAQAYRLTGMTIGRDVWIDRGVQFTAPELIVIGDRVGIATGASIVAEVYSVHSRIGYHKRGAIVLEDDAWIGTKATIVAGVHIGEGATVAANSLATADVPAWCVAVGVPATNRPRK